MPRREQPVGAALEGAATVTTQVDRDRLVRDHLDLARALAYRYVGRGEPLPDLQQIACLGLVKAAARYDPTRGTTFSTFAVPTIVGELRRHFRDTGWAVHVPRRLQELTCRLPAAAERLSRTLARAPTTSELAAELDVSEEETLHALEAIRAYRTTSLDAPASAQVDESWAIGEVIGDEDHSLDTIVDREAARHAIAALPDRERRILTLRFFGERTQADIARELGISQMHVSRLITQTLAQIRSSVLEERGQTRVSA